MTQLFAALGFSIQLLPGWSAELRLDNSFGKTGHFLAIIPATNDALLRLTPDDRDIVAVADWVKFVVHTNRVKGRSVSEVRCGDFSGNLVEFKSGEEWIRGWTLYYGSTPLDATYRCNVDMFGRDDVVVDKMLSTLCLDDQTSCSSALLSSEP